MTLLPPVERRPLYQQVKTALTQKLINGEWRPGDKLPAESDLARTVCVSLGTLRRATQELVDEGIFERRAGVGTLVSTFQTRGYWNRFQPLVRTDGTPRFDERRQIVFETVPAPEFVATVLNLALGAPVLRMVRHMMKGKEVVARLRAGRPLAHAATDVLHLRHDARRIPHHAGGPGGASARF